MIGSGFAVGFGCGRGYGQERKNPKPAAAKPQASYKIIENNPCKINSCPQIDGI